MTAIKKMSKERQRLGYRRIATLLVSLVIVPTVLLLAVGIVLMGLGSSMNVVFGVLTVSFVALVVTGVVLVLVFLRREANLSELQSDFVSKVSHELRTPLTAIRLLAETMERSNGSPEVRDKCLAAMRVDTERLSGLIERLLDWGRMEAGRKQFDLHLVEVKDVIDDAVHAFSPLRHSAGEIRFTCDVPQDLPAICVDKGALADAVVNLLSNAIKYGGSPAEVKLSASINGDGRSVAIEVRDNGRGIPRPEHRRIFDKFYRIDDRLSRGREGSGLGLAIVKHIVRAHRGRIAVESAAGAGSTFRIILPAYPQRAASRAPASFAASPTEVKPSGP